MLTLDERELLMATLNRHHLTRKAPCRQVLHDLCGLQAQFANNPRYALRIRGSDFDDTTWGDGLVKIWSFRHTLHVVPAEEAGLYLSARGGGPAGGGANGDEVGGRVSMGAGGGAGGARVAAIGAGGAKDAVGGGWPGSRADAWTGGWGIDGDRMAYWADFLLGRVLAGVRNRDALKVECRAAGMGQDELSAVFHGWGGAFYEMNRRGLVAYAPGTAKDFVPLDGVRWMDAGKARARVLRRYFAAYGPATLDDFAAFTGYKRREVADALDLAAAPLRSCSCGGKEYLYLGALDPSGDVPPCLFLAGFDQLLMGYKDRSRVMDERDKRNVVTVSGIVAPTVLLGGRVRAKWKKDGAAVVVTPFSRVAKRDRRLIERRALELFRGDVDEVRFAV
jgi:hypothetical protein